MNTTTADSALAAPAGAAAGRIAAFFFTSIGRKVVKAVTGIALYLFVIAHMIGNLQVFLGAEALNAYGAFLRTFLHGAGIWIARGGLLAAVGLHIWAATSLTISNLSARPVGYRATKSRESTYASRTMIWSGPVLAIFVVYHLMHLTWGNAHPSFIHGDVYHNVVEGFRVPIVTGFYVLAMLALGLHMYHGVWSMLQTLGLSHPKWNGVRFALSAGSSAVVVAGNIFMPVAVLIGIVR